MKILVCRNANRLKPTYAVYNNYKVIIVFDAYKVNGSIEKTEVVNKNLEIVFTKEGEIC